MAALATRTRKKTARRKKGTIRVALAQVAPVLGDVGRNVKQHVEMIGEARRKRADMVVFPELSLTGYFLRDVVPEVAIGRDDAVVGTLAEAAGPMRVVFGCVEESKDHHFYNSAFYVEDGRVGQVHRKVYLPTYGMFDEQRYFAEGYRIRSFDTPFGRAGMLICEDMWHLSCGLILAAEGVKCVIAIASSPTRGVSEAPLSRSAEAWNHVTSVYARFFGVFVVFVNRVGFEDGVNFWGGSAVCAPGGERIAEAPMQEEALVTCDIDPALIRRERIFSPLGRDEKIDVTIRELTRVRDEAAV